MANILYNRFLIIIMTFLLAGGIFNTVIFGTKWSKAVAFDKSDEVIVNPLSGYAPNAEYTKLAEKYSLIYVDVTWRELEPEEEKYDFASIDEENQLEKWRSEGKRVVFRFVLDKPRDEKHMDIPDWLYKKTNGAGYAYDNSYGKGFSPDYGNEYIICCHSRAIKALGEYYGKDDFFAFIELGSLGHWGEWHVKYDSGIPRLPDESIRDKYIKPYITAFPNSRILMRRPFTPVKTYGFGVYNDMTGDKDSTLVWLDWINNGGVFTQTGEENAITAVPEVWNNAAVGGEFTSSVTMDWLLRYHLDETLSLVKKSHMTFIGPKMPSKEIYADGAGEVLKNIGYRFRIKKAKISASFDGKNLKIRLDWINDGAAPIYWNWDAFVYLVDANGSIIEKSPVYINLTELKNEKTIRTYSALSLKNALGKKCRVCIGIEDPLTGKPAIKFAMNQPRVGNMSVLYEWYNK